MENIPILSGGDMKTSDTLLAMLLGVIATVLLSGCYCYAVRYDGPYEGRVIDAETGQPIEGVVVLGVWYEEYPTVAGAMHKFHDAKETVTDKNGEFLIRGMGLELLSNVIPMDVLFFKAGYGHIGMGPWSGLKSMGRTGEYEETYDPVKNIRVKKILYNPKKQVKWEGNKAIIPLQKLTMEERKRQAIPDIYVEKRVIEKTSSGVLVHSLFIPKNIKQSSERFKKDGMNKFQLIIFS